LNVYESKKIKFNKEILTLGIPILGICFGHQMISKELGGKVKQSKNREFGLVKIKKLKSKKFNGKLKRYNASTKRKKQRRR